MSGAPIVLAFSGGLDTSYLVPRLAETTGRPVVAVSVDTGGLDAASRTALAARANDITYNRLIQGLKAAGVEVDRKNLADIAITDAAAFAALVEVARAALPEDVNAPAGDAA